MTKSDRRRVAATHAIRIAVPAALFVLLLVGFVVLPRPKFAALVGLHSEESAHTEGRLVYAQHCASCHGVKLEGQPNWKQRLASGRLPAPPHDADGHTWHHADSVLFDITKRGTAAVVGGGYESDMPGFDGVLTDKQIRAALAFIKSTWPQRERRHQERITKQSMRQVNR